MFTEGKVINPEKIEATVARKQGMTFDTIEEKVVPKLISIREETRKEEEKISLEEEKDITYYDAYLFCFRLILYGLTLDELEFIRDNNLFKLQKNNLLDYRCQLILDEKIDDFRRTLDNLNKVAKVETVGNYFQRYGNIFSQAIQGAKLEVILGLAREDVQLTPLGEKLKTCIANLRKIRSEILDEGETSIGPVVPKK